VSGPAARRALLAAAGVISLGLCGCGRNAFFELDVVLPANDTGTDRYAVVSFASGDQDFGALWAGNQTLDGVHLSTTAASTQHASIENPSGQFDAPVEAKVNFCGNPSCTATGDDTAPELRLKVVRAFYEGERTSFTWTIACIPSSDPKGTCAEKNLAIKQVEKCEVAGCRAGTSSNYCVGDKHFCE
jgi:hypothetical protein